MSPSDDTPKPQSKRVSFSMDYRFIVIFLLAVIAAMLLLWRPWSATAADDRTVAVTGEAKLTAEPDEFVFYPRYQIKHTDKDIALALIAKKSESVIAKLKELGVPDNKIKTSSSGHDGPVYYPERGSEENNYALSLTITVGTHDLAQKVQDYLVTTGPTGAVSPQAVFSDAKRKELESRARDEATKDARSKAEQSARNLGFKISKVKSVQDGAGFDGPYPMHGRGEISTQALDGRAKLNVQPGENELHYSITVTYFVR